MKTKLISLTNGSLHGEGLSTEQLIRCDEHTQAEHRWIAEEIKEIFKTKFPNIATALDW